MRRRSLVQLISAVLLLAGSLTLLASQSGREGFKGFWGAKFRSERHSQGASLLVPLVHRLRRWSDFTTGIQSPSMHQAWITRRWPKGRIGTSASSSDPGVPAVRWPSCTSRSMRPSTRLPVAMRASPGSIARRKMLPLTPPSRKPPTTRSSRCSRRRRTIMRGHMKDELAVLPTDGRVQGFQIGRQAAQGGDEAGRPRRVCAYRAAPRHRVHPEQRAGEVAAGSDQQSAARHGCALGRGQAVRPGVCRAIPRPAAARPG